MGLWSSKERRHKNAVVTSQVATVNIKAKFPKVTRGDPIVQSVLGAKQTQTNSRKCPGFSPQLHSQPLAPGIPFCILMSPYTCLPSSNWKAGIVIRGSLLTIAWWLPSPQTVSGTLGEWMTPAEHSWQQPGPFLSPAFRLSTRGLEWLQDFFK